MLTSHFYVALIDWLIDWLIGVLRRIGNSPAELIMLHVNINILQVACEDIMVHADTINAHVACSHNLSRSRM